MMPLLANISTRLKSLGKKSPENPLLRRNRERERERERERQGERGGNREREKRLAVE